jgi:autophagy-related protein 18
MLATASDKGTVVRVFSVPDAKKLWQFRRGSSSARIWSINFNLSSTLLSVSSDSSTIHIYKLAVPTGRQPHSAENSLASQLPSTPGGNGHGNGTGEETPSEASATSPPPNFLSAQSGASATSSLKRRSYHIGKSFVGGVGGYLPRSVSEMWEPQRDFAHIKLKGTANQARTVVAMSS